MIVFDADICTFLFAGEPTVVNRALVHADQDHWTTIVVAEEILRGRLSAVRRADTGTGRRSIEQAYRSPELSLAHLQQLKLLSYTPAADALFAAWRQQKIRVGTRDLRIAAICVAHQAKLISRNRRDFDLVPGLSVEYW